MSTKSVLAGIAVADFSAALDWYERLVGEPVARFPMEGVAEWQWSGENGIQVISGVGTPGAAMVTLVVENLDAYLSRLIAVGIQPGEIQGTPGIARVSTVRDPDGNRIALAEDLRGSASETTQS